MRRCVICLERFELSAAHFAIRRHGFAYDCVACKSLYNAIRYRRMKLQRTDVLPFAEQERRIILHAIKACYGNINKAARLLQIGRSSIFRKIKEYQTAGTYTEIEHKASKMLQQELEEFERKWSRLKRRARIIRKREARTLAFSKKLDTVLSEVQRERLERQHTNAIRQAQRRVAEEHPS